MKMLLFVMALLTFDTLWAYSSAETNQVVRRALARVIACHPDNLVGRLPLNGPSPDTWRGFLGGDAEGGWQLAEKKAAFDWYLSSLGTADLSDVQGFEAQLVRVALAQCERLSYTNAVPSLKGLAFNQNGIHRGKAIELVIKYQSVDSATTAFVENVLTNVSLVGEHERDVACGHYAQRILSFNPEGGVQQTAKAVAVNMLYRNRYANCALTKIVDDLFVETISGYETSSNRLDFALHVLSSPDCNTLDYADFTAVTNPLLSSGQPLRWVTIGGEGDE